MDKNQAEQFCNNCIITYLPEAERELAEVKKLLDPQEQYKQAGLIHGKHSSHCHLAEGLS